MSKLRSLSTAFWSDPFIEDLTPSQKLLFIYLITNEKTNMLGIYESSIKKMSFETGIKKDDVQKALSEFERCGKVKHINNYVILTNFMKHQNYNTNMKKSAIDCYNNLPQELKVIGLTVSKDNPLEGFERLSKGLGMVPKVEYEVLEDESKEEIEDESNLPEVFNFKKSLINFGFDKNKVDEWLIIRKNKKLTNTETAFNGFIREIEKTGRDPNEIFIICIEKSWGSLTAQWIKNLDNGHKNNSSTGNRTTAATSFRGADFGDA